MLYRRDKNGKWRDRQGRFLSEKEAKRRNRIIIAARERRKETEKPAKRIPKKPAKRIPKKPAKRPRRKALLEYPSGTGIPAFDMKHHVESEPILDELQRRVDGGEKIKIHITLEAWTAEEGLIGAIEKQRTVPPGESVWAAMLDAIKEAREDFNDFTGTSDFVLIVNRLVA